VGRGQEGEEEMPQGENMAKKQKEGSGCLVVWHRFESAPEGIAVSNLPNLKRLNYLKLRGVSLAAIAGFHGSPHKRFKCGLMRSYDESTFPIFSAKMVKFQLSRLPSCSTPASATSGRQRARVAGAP